GPCSPRATPTGTSRCSGTRGTPRSPPSGCSSTTTTPTASSPTPRVQSGPWRRPRPTVGRSSACVTTGPRCSERHADVGPARHETTVTPPERTPPVDAAAWGAPPPAGVHKYVPITRWLPGYRGSWLARDVPAGLTVWGLVVPAGMG